MVELIHSLTLIFITSAIILFALDRFDHPAIPGYILAGIGVGFFIDGIELINIAQLGIAFLVFIFGMKMEPDRLREVGGDAGQAAVLQIAFIMGIVYGITTLFGVSTMSALYLSIAAALSSSLVGLELIRNKISLDLLHGRLSESINLIQDIIGIFLIIAITSTPFTTEVVLNNVIAGIGFIGGALFLRNNIAPRIADMAGGSRELMMLTGMTMLTGFLFLAEYLGLSILVGAFAAGMSLAKFPYNLELLDSIGSLKDFFAAIFFVILGALLTFPSMHTLIIAIALIFVTSFLKPALIVIILIWQGYDSRTAYLTSMGVDHVSEFALILAIQAFIAQAIYTPIFEGIILAATATMILSSYTTQYSEPLYQRLVNVGWIETNYEKLNERSHISEDLSDHIILAGYGVQGKLIAEDLRREGKEFIVVENDPEQISEASKREDHYVFGNVLSDFTWEKAKADKAQLIISTIPDKQASEEILNLDTDADVILRASTYAEAQQLLKDGALYVDIPEFMASEQLVRHLQGVLTEESYAKQLRKRNLEELKNYFYSSEPL